MFASVGGLVLMTSIYHITIWMAQVVVQCLHGAKGHDEIIGE